MKNSNNKLPDVRKYVLLMSSVLGSSFRCDELLSKVKIFKLWRVLLLNTWWDAVDSVKKSGNWPIIQANAVKNIPLMGGFLKIE
jgi:hypothetical protein